MPATAAFSLEERELNADSSLPRPSHRYALGLSPACRLTHLRSALEQSDFVLWPSTSVRCHAAIFPDSEVDRTWRGHRQKRRLWPKAALVRAR